MFIFGGGDVGLGLISLLIDRLVLSNFSGFFGSLLFDDWLIGDRFVVLLFGNWLLSGGLYVLNIGGWLLRLLFLNNWLSVLGWEDGAIATGGI